MKVFLVNQKLITWSSQIHFSVPTMLYSVINLKNVDLSPNYTERNESSGHYYLLKIFAIFVVVKFLILS